MALKTNYKFLSIGDDKNIFVENYSHDQLFITIEIRNNPSNAKAIGEKIWSIMRRYCSANLHEESYKKFENSLKEVNKVLHELHTNDLSILIGFIAGKDLYLTQTGNAVAYLAHKNSIEVVSQDLSDKEANAFTSVVKGEVKAGDFVVFSSVSLFPYISRVDLAKVLNAKAITYSLSRLNELISTKISGKAGIIGITFEKTPKFIRETVAAQEKLPHKLLAKILKIKVPKVEIKIPKFLNNIVHSIKNLLFSVRHRKSKLLGIFVIVVVILVLGIIWYAKNSVLIREQVSKTVINGEANGKFAETILDKVENIRRVENPKVYADFSIKQPNINLLGLLALKGKFFTFEYNKLYGINFDKIEELATFSDGETVVSATDFENQDSLIFITKSGKLFQYKHGKVTFVKTTDGEFRSGIAIDDWGDLIYILDSYKNRIWRYSYLPSRGVFKSAKQYNVGNALKDVVDFAIDGLIYILHKDASIDQLYKGQKQNFSIQNKPLTGFDTPSKIYTEDGFNQIFVMYSGNSRIFIYDKDLKTRNALYNGQIVFPTISGLHDLYVDKNANKLYLLDAQKVYEVQL